MKFKKLFLISLLLVILTNITVFSQDASPSQFFYVIKKLLPETKSVSIFMDPEIIDKERVSLNRAALQNQLKVKIYPIASPIELGKNIRQLSGGSVLVVYTSDVLTSKSSAAYVLKKCIEKNITVVSSSQLYSDLGAFLGLLRGEDNKLKIVVNFKQYANLQSNVTADRLQLVGAKLVTE